MIIFWIMYCIERLLMIKRPPRSVVLIPFPLRHPELPELWIFDPVAMWKLEVAAGQAFLEHRAASA